MIDKGLPFYVPRLFPDISGPLVQFFIFHDSAGIIDYTGEKKSAMKKIIHLF